MKPTILHQGQYTKEDVRVLATTPGVRIKDIREQQLAELYEIEHPSTTLEESGDERNKYVNKRLKHQSQGDWIFLPWSNILIHSVCHQEYDQIRLNRNQLLITQAEQERLKLASVGFLGLSIGAHFVHSLARTGVGSNYRIADPDTVSTSNLNRVTARISDIGELKTTVLSQQIYEINPYQDINIFDQGIHTDNIQEFLTTPTPLSMIYEAVDDFRLKIEIRLRAKQFRIPVIMITNLGDSIVVDIERYDVDPELPLFNGLIGDHPEQILDRNITSKDLVNLTLRIIPPEITPTRALATLQQYGQTVVGRPQIYSTVAAGGGIAGYIARRILIGPTIESGRYSINFGNIDSVGMEEESLYNRQELLSQLMTRRGGE